MPEADVEHVIQRFEEEYENSLIRQKFRLDTSTATVAESVAEFAGKIQACLTDGDLLRLALRRGRTA